MSDPFASTPSHALPESFLRLSDDATPDWLSDADPGNEGEGEDDAPLTLHPPERPTIENLRHSHHQLAQLVASGRKSVDIAFITGYSAQYISKIKSDPSFQSLIRYYSGVAELSFIDAMARLKNLGLDAVEALQERLARGEDEFSTKELLEIIDLTLSRPHLAQIKAGGMLEAAREGTRAFEIVFKAGGGQGALASEGSPRVIEGMVEPEGSDEKVAAE